MAERRRLPRARTLKGGKIVYNKTSVVTCTVRNLTDLGALLLVPRLTAVPDEFRLELERNNERHNCRVIWRKEDRLGVEFA